jgi:hypothetical protein
MRNTAHRLATHPPRGWALRSALVPAADARRGVALQSGYVEEIVRVRDQLAADAKEGR